jgi:hypothetical protein
MVKEDVIAAIEEVLEKRSKIDSTVHLEDHLFIAHLRAEKEKTIRLTDKIKEQVLGWGAISIIGFLGYHLLNELRDVLVSLLKFKT